MSMPPTAMRLMRWQSSHRVMADSILAAVVLILNVLLGLGPVLTANTPIASWLPITITAIALCTAALCVRRTYPVVAWAAVVLIPTAHDIAIYHIYHFDPQTFTIIVNSLPAYNVIAIPMCLTALAMRHRPSRVWAAAFASAAPSTITSIWLEGLSVTETGLVYLVSCLICIIGALIGMLLRIQEVQLQEMRMRSVRLALAREQEALLSAANERSRIAREMHDVVAHSLAVMITMADGATAAIDRNPAMAKDALAMLAETGRSALADTRRLVGVLRDGPETSSAPAALSAASAQSAQSPQPAQSDSPPQSVLALKDAEQRIGQSIDGDADDAIADADAPRHRGSAPTSTGSAPVVRDLPVPEFAPPGTVAPVEPSEKIADLRREATDAGTDTSQGDTPMAPAPEQADLATLVSRFKAAGVPVTYTWKGSRLPEDKGLQLAMFRITQEALTNVLRYAPTTRAVRVTVDRHVGTAVLTVDNDAAPGSRPMHGSGKGLIGMRERAAVYGGSVQAGPTATGWRVRAVLRWDEDDEGTSPWQLPL